MFPTFIVTIRISVILHHSPETIVSHLISHGGVLTSNIHVQHLLNPVVQLHSSGIVDRVVVGRIFIFLIQVSLHHPGLNTLVNCSQRLEIKIFILLYKVVSILLLIFATLKFSVGYDQRLENQNLC